MVAEDPADLSWRAGRERKGADEMRKENCLGKVLTDECGETDEADGTDGKTKGIRNSERQGPDQPNFPHTHRAQLRIPPHRHRPLGFPLSPLLRCY